LPPFNGATCLPWSTDFPYVAVLIGGHVVASLVLLLLCGLMFCARRKQSWLSPQKHTRIQITAIALCNVFCILPLSVLGLITSAIATYPPAVRPFFAEPINVGEESRYITQTINVDLVLTIVMFLLCLRLSVNPILYVAFAHNLRQDISKFARKILFLGRISSYQSSESNENSDFRFTRGPLRTNRHVDEEEEPDISASVRETDQNDSDTAWQQMVQNEPVLSSPTAVGDVQDGVRLHKALMNSSGSRTIPPKDFYDIQLANSSATHNSVLRVPPSRYVDWCSYRTDSPNPPQPALEASEQPCTSKSDYYAEDLHAPVAHGRLTSQYKSRLKQNSLKVDVSRGRQAIVVWSQHQEHHQPVDGSSANKLSQSCESSTSKDSGIQSEPDYLVGCAYSSGSSSLPRSVSSQISDGPVRLCPPVLEPQSAPVQNSERFGSKLVLKKIFVPYKSSKFPATKPSFRMETVL